ncbi:hypothetical protein [Alteromonas phage PB15]|nr:hypothetical protein [Alteromonas phage PB15]
MQINEQELAAAVERLREGDCFGLLVSEDDVMSRMIDKGIGMELVNALFTGDDASALFEREFDSTARDLLREAYRTKLEHEAGL